eukprot:8445276-Pyramimonas_sp.AAC.1
MFIIEGLVGGGAPLARREVDVNRVAPADAHGEELDVRPGAGEGSDEHRQLVRARPPHVAQGSPEGKVEERVHMDVAARHRQLE